MRHVGRRRRMLLATVGTAVLVVLTAKPVPEMVPFERPLGSSGAAIVLHEVVHESFATPTEVNPLFVLVIGSDVREGDPNRGRGDSLHILAINTETGAGTVVGIPRDTYTPVPGVGTRKINSALYFGGAQRQVAAVEQLSGLQMHYWALIEFSRFRKLVDELGGVDVDIPYRIADRFSGAYFDPGPRHLNGTEALAFARVRKGIPRGDFGRSFNQGTLLVEGLRKFNRDTTSPYMLGRYLKAFLAHVETDVGLGDLMDLAAIGRSIDPDQVTNVVLPGSPGSAGGASVVFVGQGAQDIFRGIADDGVL